MLNAKENFLSNFYNNIEIQNRNKYIMRNTELAYNFIISLSKGMFELILVFILIYLVKGEIIEISIAVVLFSYRANVMENFMEKLGDMLTEIKKFNISCNRVFSLLENREFPKEEFGKKHINNIKGNFEFDNVTFGYIEDYPVLKNISFKIKENEMVAFVGKSGAGKTTIFNLLCKIYDIDNGVIKIDGEDIKNLDEYSIRENITIISQNPYIFNMSIRDNLNLVKKDLTEEEMIEACRMACLDEFIDTLPEKYDTIVGEGGVILSGGQRQRLAIARAFIQDTKIILFDEATSALDNETQEHIQQAISNMKDKYTILIIAHRLSTIVNSDRIMLVEDGHITDSGTHKELLLKNKTYKKLYENEILDK